MAKRTGTPSRTLAMASRGEDARRFREENIESSDSEEEESSEEEENSVPQRIAGIIRENFGISRGLRIDVVVQRPLAGLSEEVIRE